MEPESNPTTMMKIPRRLFLYAYCILPILLTIVAIDYWRLDSTLLPHLGITALIIPLYIIIFDLPHIIASFLSFFDKEYVSYYRKHLFFYLPGLLIATAMLLYVDYTLGLVFYLLNDLWHGVKQKTGISLILGAKPGKLHLAWTIVPFVVSSIAYVTMMRPSAIPDQLQTLVPGALLVGVLGIIFISIVKVWNTAPQARWYVTLVSSLFVCSYLFVSLGYAFFAVLAFRFVHDVSAFAFYVTHDHNRNQQQTKNWLYKLVSKTALPYIILVPLLGFVGAFLVRSGTEKISNHVMLEVGFGLVILVGMSHYYLESVMWKRNTPHRKHVGVTK